MAVHGELATQISTTVATLDNSEEDTASLFLYVPAAVLFAIGVLANLAVITATIQIGVKQARRRMLHLLFSMANLVFIVIEFSTNYIMLKYQDVSFPFGSTGCKCMQSMRAFSCYCIAYVLVAMW